MVAGVGEKGIGDHTAAKFAAEGFAVGMLARRRENLDRLEAEIAGAKGYQCDVSKPDELHSAIERITAELGPVDVLIVNTSGGAFKPFADTTQEEFDLALSTGPSALFAFAKAVTPGMIERGHGVIGITGATAAWRGMPSTSAKAPCNFAMRALAQALARDLGPKGVHVFHVVIDALVDQPRTHAWMPSKPDDEFISPREIAETYFTLANQPRSCWAFEINLVPGAVMGSMATI